MPTVKELGATYSYFTSGGYPCELSFKLVGNTHVRLQLEASDAPEDDLSKLPRGEAVGAVIVIGASVLERILAQLRAAGVIAAGATLEAAGADEAISG